MITNANIKSLKNKTSTIKVDGKSKEIQSDRFMISVGRGPLSLGLEELGIKFGQIKEVVVDKYNRTNIKGVYEIGDVVGQVIFAHIAYKHAKIAVNNITFETVSVIHQNSIQPCIYTHPEVVTIGMAEQEAIDSGKDFIIAKYNMAIVGKAVIANQSKGSAEFIVDKKYGEIIGCHIEGLGANWYDCWNSYCN